MNRLRFVAGGVLAVVCAVMVSAQPPGRASDMIVLAVANGPNGAPYVFEIPPSRAETLPHWDQVGEPPLSMTEAQTLAAAWLRRKAPEAQRLELAASSFLRTTPSGPLGSAASLRHWYYRIGFDRIVGDSRSTGGADSMAIVLLDGSIVEPRIESLATPPVPDGVFRPGNGVTLPVPIFQQRPSYTSAAMRAKIEGSVLMQAVVRPDGTVSDVEILRSLDPVYGLDQEAIAAAKKWRFRPGTRDGVAVPVVITIELTFTLRK